MYSTLIDSENVADAVAVVELSEEDVAMVDTVMKDDKNNLLSLLMLLLSFKGPRL